MWPLLLRYFYLRQLLRLNFHFRLRYMAATRQAATAEDNHASM